MRTDKVPSIQGRMSLLLLAFFLLVVVSAGMTFWGIDQQKQDALIINLAGRQRMFLQQMTRLALEIERGAGPQTADDLQFVAGEFSQTLAAFHDGGLAPYLGGQMINLRPAQDPAIQAQIERIARDWREFQAVLDVLARVPPGSPEFEAGIQAVESGSPLLISQADALVRQYEALSTFKLNRLRIIQIGFAVTALLLLGVGAMVTRGSVLAPLQALASAARRIGGGDLHTPVASHAPQEVQLLGETLDSMRAGLLASQAELLAWTETLEQRVAERTRELAALNAVSQEISSRLAIDDVLGSITEKACQMLAGDVAFLCLLDEGQLILKLHSAEGPREAIARFSSPADAAYAGQVLSSPQAVQCNLEGCQGYCEIMHQPYRRSHLAVALKVDRRNIGALCVGSRQENFFQPEAAELLTRLANIASIAIQNARLYEQAERSATLEERQRIAAEMHDGLAQTLGYLHLTMDRISELVAQGQVEQAQAMFARVQSVIDQANLDIRRAITRLNEDIPLHFTLQEQLQDLAKECSSPERMVEWHNQLDSPLVLPRQEMEQVLRVAREALFNAKRHSQAQHIQLGLEPAGERIRLSVVDDGQGFDPAAPHRPDNRQRFGLTIMQARAARIQAKLEIHSAPGEGTQVYLTWLPGREPDGEFETVDSEPVILPAEK